MVVYTKWTDSRGTARERVADVGYKAIRGLADKSPYAGRSAKGKLPPKEWDPAAALHIMGSAQYGSPLPHSDDPGSLAACPSTLTVATFTAEEEEMIQRQLRVIEQRLRAELLAMKAGRTSPLQTRAFQEVGRTAHFEFKSTSQSHVSSSSAPAPTKGNGDGYDDLSRDGAHTADPAGDSDKLGSRGDGAAANAAYTFAGEGLKKQKRQPLTDEFGHRLQRQLKAAIETNGGGVEGFKRLMRKFDKDGSGTLAGDELKELVRQDLQVHPDVLTDTDIEQLIDALDDDGSQTLSADEIVDFIIVGPRTFYHDAKGQELPEAQPAETPTKPENAPQSPMPASAPRAQEARHSNASAVDVTKSAAPSPAPVAQSAAAAPAAVEKAAAAAPQRAPSRASSPPSPKPAAAAPAAPKRGSVNAPKAVPKKASATPAPPATGSLRKSVIPPKAASKAGAKARPSK